MLEMEVKIFVTLLLKLIWLQSVSSLIPSFQKFILQCQGNPTGMPLYLKGLKGIWHEVGRFPESYAVSCLSVEFPESANPDLNIKLNYVSRIGRNVRKAKDNVTFHMDKLTTNSIFHTEYQMRKMKTFLRYVIMYTDYVNISLICGYSPISPLIMIKLFSRNETLSPRFKDFVNKELAKTPFKSRFLWLDKSNCDKAMCVFVSSTNIFNSCYCSCTLKYIPNMKVFNTGNKKLYHDIPVKLAPSL